MNGPELPQNDLLSSDEVMNILLANANLRRRAATCVLPAVRCAGEFRFRKSDLDRWIELQQTTPVSDRRAS
jgi:hypothetical protein